ncbi:MAG: DUF2452 domain-containing protein [Bacteroidota bacterium]
MSKKPDPVVFNEEDERYDASLKPYATNVGAPAIITHDTTAWKNTNIDKVNKQVKARYGELKAEFDALMEQFEYNNLVYHAKFSFEPIVGETYHLYRDTDQQSFLSLIAPEECHFDHVGTFRLNADKMWERIQNKNPNT